MFIVISFYQDWTVTIEEIVAWQKMKREKTVAQDLSQWL